MGLRRDDNGFERVVKRGLKARECEAIGGRYERIGQEDLCFLDTRNKGDTIEVKKPEIRVEDVAGGDYE